MYATLVISLRVRSTYLHYTIIHIAGCSAAERKNPLMSEIAILAPLSTLADFEGKEWIFLLKKFLKQIKGSHFEKKTQNYV